MKSEAFERSRQKSKALSERAKRSIAGGVTSELRAASPFPIFFERAEGSHKWDVDGNEYIDYCMGSAALLLGHAHPAIVKAVIRQAAKGTLYSGLTELELEWADLVRELYPSAEQVRFVGSGTEANILAIRIARAVMGRPKILRLEGHFHGWGDDTAVGIKVPFDHVMTHGLPPGVAEATVVCQANPQSVEAALLADPHIAAIILEPTGASWGTVPLPEGFLKTLRDLADKHGVLLIFDEVITGFRWNPGGAQALYGVTPDLTALAKNLTGGLPGGAVAGRADLMRLLDPALEYKGIKSAVFHRGTFNANPISAVAGVAALQIFQTGEPQRRADELAGKLRIGMQGVLRKHEVAGAVYGESSVFHVFLGKGAKGTVEGLNAEELKSIPPDQVAAFQRALRQRGVDPLSYTGGVTSAAHTEDDIEKTIEVFEDAIRELVENEVIERL
ncbi:aspartate aminotransferase family protein [Nitrospinota bacterium]